MPRAWELGELLDWALAESDGGGVQLRRRWRASRPGTGGGYWTSSPGSAVWALVCVRPLLVCRSREGEDLTRDKSDPKDEVLIARLASELRCYEPERADAVRARLRHLGARRLRLTTDATGQVNQIRDLLECAWPAVLAAAGSLSRSSTWCAAVAVVLDRCRVTRPGPRAGPGPVRGRGSPGAAPAGRGPAVPADRARGVRRTAHPPGSSRTGRARWNARAWPWPTARNRARLADTETRMVAVLDELGLTGLVTTIAGLTAVGAAAYLAETGDPARFATPVRWSSTPDCARATTPPECSRARRRSPDADGPARGWPPGGRSGRRCRTTRCWPPGSPT